MKNPSLKEIDLKRSIIKKKLTHPPPLKIKKVKKVKKLKNSRHPRDEHLETYFNERKRLAKKNISFTPLPQRN